MMNMKLNMIAKQALLLTISTVVLTGCFRMEPPGKKNSSSMTNPSLGSGTSDTGGFNVTSGVVTAQVFNFRGVASSYSSVTGVAPSAAANALLNNDLSTYSLSGSPDSLNGPMMFNFAKLGAEFCLTLVNQEKAQAANARKFFNSFNFAAAPATGLPAGSIEDASNRISRIFCGHNASAMIQNAMRSEIASGLGATVQDTTDAALMACTAFIASPCVAVNN